MPVSSLPEEIFLNVEGVGWNLLRKSLGIKVKPLQINIDNPLETKKIPGSTIPGLITDQVSDIQLNYVLTDTLYLNMDKITSRSFKLLVDSSSINLEDNFVISSSINLSSDSVILTGPMGIINEMEPYIVLSLLEEEIDENHEEEIQIVIPNQSLIKRNPPTVTIDFKIDEIQEFTLNIPIVSVLENTDYSNYKVIDSLVSVTYQYPVSFPRLSPDDFTFSLNKESILNTDSTVEMYISSAPYLTFLTQNDTIIVKVSENK